MQKARNNEETYDIIYRRSHPVLWSAFYYSIVFVPIAVLTYRGRYYNVFVDQVGLDQDAIMYKNITKRSVRILITILFNLLALVVLFLTDERVQEIARSIRCELSGVKCADNLGWLSFRLNALSQSMKVIYGYKGLKKKHDYERKMYHYFTEMMRICHNMRRRYACISKKEMEKILNVTCN